MARFLHSFVLDRLEAVGMIFALSLSLSLSLSLLTYCFYNIKQLLDSRGYFREPFSLSPTPAPSRWAQGFLFESSTNIWTE